LRRFRGVWLLPPVVFVVCFVAACGAGGQEGASEQEETDGETMQVSATISVIQDLAEQVGGDRVEVNSIVPVGGSPETFQPSPRDAAAISESRVVLENGLGLDDWVEGLIESAGNEDQIVVELSEGLEPLGEAHDHGDHGDGHSHEGEGHGDEHSDEGDEHSHDGHEEHGDEHSHDHGDEHSHEGEDHGDEHAHEGEDHAHDDHGHEEHGDEEAGHEGHDHAEGNPHFWLDVENAKAYVETIRDTFIEADPEGAEEYEANTEEYLATLDELDSYIEEETQNIPEENRKLVTFHEAFPYFAEAYGYEEVAVILRNPDAEPSSREVAETVTAIREEEVPAIFTEPQFSQGPAETIADEAGVEVYEIYADTLLDDDSANTYEAMMRTNIDRLVEGLG
jgi:ABC-type Zn uptake system ZnuABC Zn-binding protein ZnuA